MSRAGGRGADVESLDEDDVEDRHRGMDIDDEEDEVD